MGLTEFAFGQAADPIQAALDKKDYATAFKLLKPLSDQGDPQAATVLGGLYADGLGTKANLAEAVRQGASGADASCTTVVKRVAPKGAAFFFGVTFASIGTEVN